MKESLRKRILARRDSEPELLRKKKSEKIRERLFSLEEFKRAQTILFYLAKGSEVATRKAIEETLLQGKRIVLPRIKERELLLGEIKDLEKELKKGSFGILEPKEEPFRKVSPEEINLIVLPGIAFDPEGRRIGYGKGYYDRFLKRIPKKIPLIGLAYEFQIIDHLPVKKHDRKVWKVITETRILQPPVQDPEDPFPRP